MCVEAGYSQWKKAQSCRLTGVFILFVVTVSRGDEWQVRCMRVGEVAEVLNTTKSVKRTR